MKTQDKKNTMEHIQYSTTLSELPQHLKRLRVPQRAIVHFWYELSTEQQTNTQSNWREKLESARQPNIGADKRIKSYLGIAKGVYPSANDAVAFIRNERNLWD